MISEKEDEKDVFIERHEFKVENMENNIATYKLDLIINDPGSYNYGLRVFAKNDLLPHRLDFRFLHWI